MNLVNNAILSLTLPTDISKITKSRLEKYGVIFRAPVSEDPLFQHVDAPPGWQKVPTKDPLWSDLVDERGIKRVAIFYDTAPENRKPYALGYA